MACCIVTDQTVQETIGAHICGLVFWVLTENKFLYFAHILHAVIFAKESY